MTHTHIINSLIRKYGYKSYLEIGVSNPEHNFNTIQLPAIAKVGVDPERWEGADYHGQYVQSPSNEYFRNNRLHFDIVFVDGLHHWEQALADIINAAQVLNAGGTIVVHDCLPTSEAMQQVPRGDQKVWTGDVYKAMWVAQMLLDYTFEKLYVIDSDYGVGVFEFKYTAPKTTLPEWEKHWIDVFKSTMIKESPSHWNERMNDEKRGG